MTGLAAQPVGEMFAENVGLAHCIARRMARRVGLQAEELWTDALVGLWRASLEHDPSRGAFSPFAGIVIEHSIGRRLTSDRRRRKRSAPEVPWPALEHDGEEIALDPIDPRSQRAEQMLVDRLTVEQLLDRLTRPRERDVIRLRFLEGMTLEETAAHIPRACWGEGPLGRERVRQLEVRALKELRATVRTDAGWSGCGRGGGGVGSGAAAPTAMEVGNAADVE